LWFFGVWGGFGVRCGGGGFLFGMGWLFYFFFFLVGPFVVLGGGLGGFAVLFLLGAGVGLYLGVGFSGGLFGGWWGGWGFVWGLCFFGFGGGGGWGGFFCVCVWGCGGGGVGWGFFFLGGGGGLFVVLWFLPPCSHLFFGSPFSSPPVTLSAGDLPGSRTGLSPTFFSFLPRLPSSFTLLLFSCQGGRSWLYYTAHKTALCSASFFLLFSFSKALPVLLM